MNFPDLPVWVAWLAQDADGACARKGQAVAVKPLKRQQPRSGATKPSPINRTPAGMKTRLAGLCGWASVNRRRIGRRCWLSGFAEKRFFNGVNVELSGLHGLLRSSD